MTPASEHRVAISGSDMSSRIKRLSGYLRGHNCAYLETRCTPAGDLDAILAALSQSTPDAKQDHKPAGTEREADIVLVSQDRCGVDGYQLHGLFFTFADAARHVAKDAGLSPEQTEALIVGWSKDGDRHESAEVGEWWVAARQPIHRLAVISGGDHAIKKEPK